MHHSHVVTVKKNITDKKIVSKKSFLCLLQRSKKVKQRLEGPAPKKAREKNFG